MDHVEFNDLFKEEFARPLAVFGFSFVGKSVSLRYRHGTRDLWIKRIKGKWPHPGIARSVICFRHDFLRPVSRDDLEPAKFTVDDFPRKLTFDSFDTLLKPKLDYQPENSGRWLTSDLAYGDMAQKTVSAQLRKMRKLIETKALPWVNSRTEKEELSQISKFGEQAWCEKRWIEDYERYISSKQG